MITFDATHIGYKDDLIKDINGSFSAGQLVAICGANGCGKSTLFRTIAGRTPPLQGKISYNNEYGENAVNAERQGIVTLCSPTLSSYGNTTFNDIVVHGRIRHTGFFAKLTREDQTIVDEALCAMDIDHKKNTLISEASDGERQKALLARSFASQSPVLLLDEPTAFLDFPSKKSLMKRLTNLAKQHNILILMSSHDLYLCEEFAHDLVLIKDKQFYRKSDHENFQHAWDTFKQ